MKYRKYRKFVAIKHNKMPFLQSCPVPNKTYHELQLFGIPVSARLNSGAANPCVSIFHEAGDGGNDGGIILWSQLPRLGARVQLGGAMKAQGIGERTHGMKQP